MGDWWFPPHPAGLCQEGPPESGPTEGFFPKRVLFLPLMALRWLVLNRCYVNKLNCIELKWCEICSCWWRRDNQMDQVDQVTAEPVIPQRDFRGLRRMAYWSAAGGGWWGGQSCQWAGDGLSRLNSLVTLKIAIYDIYKMVPGWHFRALAPQTKTDKIGSSKFSFPFWKSPTVILSFSRCGVLDMVLWRCNGKGLIKA